MKRQGEGHPPDPAHQRGDYSRKVAEKNYMGEQSRPIGRSHLGTAGGTRPRRCCSQDEELSAPTLQPPHPAAEKQTEGRS